MSITPDPRRVDNIHVLSATILPSGEAQFECGFVIPAKEIQFIVGPAKVIRPGDKVSFAINNITVSQHEHRFSCQCGMQLLPGDKYVYHQ